MELIVLWEQVKSERDAIVVVKRQGSNPVGYLLLFVDRLVQSLSAIGHVCWVIVASLAGSCNSE